MLIDECAKRLDRHEAFLERRPVERPLVRSWKSGYYPAEQFPSGTSRWRPGTILQPEDVSFAPFADDYQRLYESQRSDGDFGYVASAYWGIPWLEAIMGCPVTVATANCCAKPCLAGPDSACESRIEDTRIAGSQRLAQCATGHHRVPGAVGSRLFSCHVCGLARGDETAVDLDANRWLAALLRFTRELVEFAAGRFPVCPPLLRGPGDAAAAMLGEMRYVTGFFDTPAAMRELLGLCARTRLAVVERLLAAIPTWASKGTVPFSSSRKSGQSPCNGIHVAGGYPSIVFSRRSVAYHQEDSAAVLNPTIFREFLLPALKVSLAAAEVNFIHLHSACLYPVDILLEDGSFDVLQINVDHRGTGPPVCELIGTFKKIQAAGRPLLLWGEFSPEEWNLVETELSPVGLSLQPIVQNTKG